MTEGVGHQFRGDVHNLDHLVIGHARGAYDAEGADDLAVDLVGGADDGELLEGHDLAFAADEDAHAFGLAGDVKQAQDLGFLLEQIEGAAQVAHVAGEVAHRQQIAFAGDDDAVCRLGERLGADIHRRLHEGADLAAQRFHFGLQALAHLFHGQARVVGVEVVGGLDELGLRVVVLREDHAVLHVAVGRDDDDQQALFGQAQEFDVPEHRRAARRHDHADELRQVGQQVGGVGDHLLRLLGHELHRGQFIALHGEHGVHEQTVAARSGDSPGRGVRAGDQPQLFQVGHDVADGGRRELQPRGARQRAGAHGLPVGDIALDQGFQQQLGTIIQHSVILGPDRPDTRGGSYGRGQLGQGCCAGNASAVRTVASKPHARMCPSSDPYGLNP
ncbi:hypothetical protein SDC9_85260 [bioreactor metagenome]|uniref:NAD-specific glutamate dehydrogenase n=1 Tax=bioreactor metagenome TaxID=1076179 RepID=A0A644ZCN3_9ZZZZ